MAGQIVAYGPHQVLSGGTKTAVKTDRPWQSKLVRSAPCPFCTVKEKEVIRVPGEGWRILCNPFSQLDYHRLLVPTECWDEPRLRTLGGPTAIETALRYALEEGAQPRQTDRPLWIGTHAGHGAGQNVPHLHWHIAEPPVVPGPLLIDLGTARRRGEILWEREWFTTVAGGVRAGQLAIVPKGDRYEPAPPLRTRHAVRKALAEEISRVIALYNEKFNDPDYGVLLMHYGEDSWHVRYTPILNNWGIGEFAALDYGTPFFLPWPHAATVAFLNS